MALFVERQFELGEDRTVILQVFQPIADRGDFRCDIRIHWAGKLKVTHAFGVDSLQALYLGLQKAHVVLATMAEREGEALTWLGDGDLDLPVVKVSEAAEAVADAVA